jgi:hypothetical protein
MSQLLPQFPNLEHLKGQAKDVLRVVRRRKPEWKLAHAQHALARGYGFTSWPELKTHVESVRGQSAAASPTARAPHADDTRPDGCDAHPIVGTWVLNTSRSTYRASHLHQNGVMLEFGMTGHTISMTQVVVDPSGRDVAVKLALRTDGHPQPVRFGKGLVLEARWADSGILEAIIKNAEQIISRGTYQVSEDGRTLAFVTQEYQVVFDRVGAR